MEESDGTELPGKEIKNSLFTIKLKIFNQIGSPQICIFIPDSNLNFIVFCCKDTVSKFVLDHDGVGLDGGVRIWISNFSKGFFDSLNLSHLPSATVLGEFRIVEHAAIDNTTNG